MSDRVVEAMNVVEERGSTLVVNMTGHIGYELEDGRGEEQSFSRDFIVSKEAIETFQKQLDGEMETLRERLEVCDE